MDAYGGSAVERCVRATFIPFISKTLFDKVLVAKLCRESFHFQNRDARLRTMSQQDNFWGGFLLGTAVGGVVGGVLGVLVSSRLNEQNEAGSEKSFAPLDKKSKKRSRLRPPTEQTIEVARQGLEDKIAQLNDAIDDVRQQLGSTNGEFKEESPRTFDA